MPDAVLLLHGQPGGAADWDGVVEHLRGRAEAIAIDRPGWGGWHGRARDLAGNAQAAVAALDERGIEKATVVGHSLGAAIAAQMAVDHPDRLDALVLVAPAANISSLDPLDRVLALPVIAELAAVATMGGLGLFLSVERVRTRLAAVSRLPGGYLIGARRALLAPPAWRSYAVEQRALVHGVPELEPRLITITAPTTILAGAHDRIVSPHAARRLAEQIPGSRLAIKQDAGHLLPQRDPEFVADHIVAALPGAKGSTLAGR
jgi:pimeloyl-ACP methyl ester carboxylesterase